MWVHAQLVPTCSAGTYMICSCLGGAALALPSKVISGLMA